MADENEIGPVKLSDSRFVDPETGQLILPSLMDKDQEEHFKIYPTWFVGDSTFGDSLRKIRNYDNADQYRSVYINLSQADLYYLKFIASFKSAQKIHLIREALLYPELFDAAKVDKSLKHLFINNLVWRWSYDHPVYGKTIDVYTLSANGYYFLKTLFGREHYFYPMLLLSPRIPDIFHIRFWETIDLYQLLASIPAYRGSTTLFGGSEEKKLMKSPLQVALHLKDEVQNLVFYPMLLTDSDQYYSSVIERWDDFTNKGENLSTEVNELPGKQNVLTFYSPTLKYAVEFAKKFKLGQYHFPILFVIGSVIKKYGIQDAFFAPLIGEKDNELKQVKFKELLDETANES